MLPMTSGRFSDAEGGGGRGIVDEPTMSAVANGARLRGVEAMVIAEAPGVRVLEAMT